MGTHDDMSGIDLEVMVHKINVKPATRPVWQKRRSFAANHNLVIAEDVDKIQWERFIQEVNYPEWMSNVVLVKKGSRKWGMYIDFTDLNKAYSKDSFPLWRIDTLVNSTAGHELLSFIDAFSGYNHIRMYKPD